MTEGGEQFSLWPLLEGIIGVFIFLFAIQVAITYTDGSVFGKLNIAKDLAMQLNTIQAVPGNAYINNTNLHGYSIYFSGNKIEVYEENYDRVKGIYYFVSPEGFDIDKRLIKPKQVVISKIGNEIKISEETPSQND